MRNKTLLLVMAGLMLLALSGSGWAACFDPFSGGTGDYEDTCYGITAGASLPAGSHEDSFYGYYAGNLTTTGMYNAFFGSYAGRNNSTGEGNTFMGWESGYANTTGANNVFIGDSTGYSNIDGFRNTYIGTDAGGLHSTGNFNTYVGQRAGFSGTSGSGNVFLGSGAGTSETGSEKLIIDNCHSGGGCTQPFIYGAFDTRYLTIDGYLVVNNGINAGSNGQSVSQMRFNATPIGGGFITSVAENNFWLSSGALWSQALGGWYQLSTDTQAVMAGSGPAGYRIMTRSGCPFGTVCPPTTRMTINYSGQVGFGVAPSYPLHMASGAHVTGGGVWTDASSRDYKDDIAELGADAAAKTLEGLNPVTFKYKAGDDERHVGFIAEDVPELVATKDRKGMSPMDVVAVLTKVVKVQQEAIQGQQQANQELTDKLTALEAQQEAHQELRQELTALKTEMKQLRESAAVGRLARIAQ
jgi:hypothetical protein